MLARLRSITPERALRLFIAANLGFLGVDIALAHAANSFAHELEWAPVVFSAVGALLLAPGLFGERLRARMRGVEVAVGLASIVVGLAGMLLHLRSSFFESQTLHDLVYAAPFAAPLAYVGVGLLILLVHMERPESPAWGAWVVFLALGGFTGNLALSLLDHAQNGFFSRLEWTSVGAAAFGVSFLLVVALRPGDARLRAASLAVLAAEALVGALGFGLHVAANLRDPAPSLRDRFVFGAPAFAPLLFADLALLGALGIWALSRSAPGARGAPAAEGAPAPDQEVSSERIVSNARSNDSRSI